MIYGKDFVLIDAENTPENLEEVRRYIKRHSLTEEQVKIVRYGDKLENLKLQVKTAAEIKGG
ncbi:hypothetical protein [Rhodopila sp.]|uniref:hypothetical protein n=1 Tax=Rhodopila sp. TaxID=2480087 RepID=UPI003D123DCA